MDEATHFANASNATAGEREPPSSPPRAAPRGRTLAMLTSGIWSMRPLSTMRMRPLNLRLTTPTCAILHENAAQHESPLSPVYRAPAPC